MAVKRSRPKYGVAILLLLLAISVYYNYINKSQPKSYPGNYPPTEHRIKKHRKAKASSDLRHLTVFTGKVTGIKDGDTFEVLYDGEPERVRLAEIDCPEKSQAFGKNAKQYASDLCFGKTVTVTSAGKRDRYNRVIGTVVTKEGVNVNEALLKAGLAWHYKQYSKNAAMDVFEADAREQHLGLWADKMPTPPWEYRKNRRSRSIE